MTPLDRLRVEKAAADCGFEMALTERDGGLELRSTRFPDSVFVRQVGVAAFEVAASSPLMLDAPGDASTVAVQGYQALYDALQTAAAHARTLPNRVADGFRRETAGLPRSTEAERLVIQRVGQNLFRAALLDYWQGRCCVTGLDVPELLRASHIKPWAICDSDDERLDVFNGLLLAPHLDALFDTGLMTVGDDGKVQLSKRLTPGHVHCLGLPQEMTVVHLHDRHRDYLTFHRTEVWRS
jgi:predicted restriction endonuclease